MTGQLVPWWHVFHRWSKWQRKTDSDNSAVQIRECAVCGQSEVRFL